MRKRWWARAQREPSIAIASWKKRNRTAENTHVSGRRAACKQDMAHDMIIVRHESTYHRIFHASQALIHRGTRQGLARYSIGMLLNQKRRSRQQSKIRRAPLSCYCSLEHCILSGLLEVKSQTPNILNLRLCKGKYVISWSIDSNSSQSMSWIVVSPRLRQILRLRLLIGR